MHISHHFTHGLVCYGHVTFNMTFHFSGSDEAIYRTTIFFIIFRLYVYVCVCSSILFVMYTNDGV